MNKTKLKKFSSLEEAKIFAIETMIKMIPPKIYLHVFNREELEFAIKENKNESGYIVNVNQLLKAMREQPDGIFEWSLDPVYAEEAARVFSLSLLNEIDSKTETGEKP